mmetsp:Transcript_34913/g.83690  ORF Transcript_34913/g.83690 Transcript_34913/m.83690 type:complete len:269 (+) Transcript_34913:127-933(+)
MVGLAAMVVPRWGVQSRRHRRVAAVMPLRLATKLRGAAPQAWGASALRALPSHTHQAESPAFVATSLEAALPGHTVRPPLDCISCHTLGADRGNGLARLRGAAPTEPGRRNPASVAEEGAFAVFLAASPSATPGWAGRGGGCTSLPGAALDPGLATLGLLACAEEGSGRSESDIRASVAATVVGGALVLGLPLEPSGGCGREVGWSSPLSAVGPQSLQGLVGADGPVRLRGEGCDKGGRTSHVSHAASLVLPPASWRKAAASNHAKHH